MKAKSQRIIVIGGGAAGFFAALRCAALQPHWSVCILEAGKRPLQKVRISGGGRCNVTHACFEPRPLSKHYPRGEKALLGPFHQFCSGDTVAWFEERGVALKIESDGRMFPKSDDSQSIIDCFLREARKRNVELRLQARVQEIQKPNEQRAHFRLKLADGEWLAAEQVLVATGSSPQMWRQLENMGLPLVPPVPSLFTFNIPDKALHQLAGISWPKVALQLSKPKLQAEGPLLITHWGLSGPAILRLSAWGARALHEKDYQFSLRLNWLPQYDQESIRSRLLQLREHSGKKQLQNLPCFDFPKRLWAYLLGKAGIAAETTGAQLSNKAVNRLISLLQAQEMPVRGKSTFKEEFVTAGGIALDAIDFKRFAAKSIPGLYFAGEVLNIDAITGGFNFQAAWTGGWLAGTAMAEARVPSITPTSTPNF